jgi:threonine aldolase
MPTRTRPSRRRIRHDFESDNTSGICREAMQAIESINRGFAGPYGSDSSTKQMTKAFQKEFEFDCSVMLVPTGTASNTIRTVRQLFGHPKATTNAGPAIARSHAEQ